MYSCIIAYTFCVYECQKIFLSRIFSTDFTEEILKQDIVAIDFADYR